MALPSALADLVLHGVRVLGFPTAARIASRYGLDAAMTTEALLDFEAYGWVRQLSFGRTSGWSPTEAGRAESQARLAAELDKSGAREAVAAAYATFLPVNERLCAACTNWQIRPLPGSPLAVNDHADVRWDDRVLSQLASVGASFARLCDQLAACLNRFDGYASRYASALAQARAGNHAWVDAPDRDSCHLVWIQFHEDLLATLGVPRGCD
jgi:hypothetical protein